MQIYIKDLGLLIGSLFFFIRLLHLPFSKKDCVRYGILVIFLMSWIPYLDRNHPHFILVTLPAIAAILCYLTKLTYDVVLNCTMLSFAISYLFFMVATFCVSLLQVAFHFTFSMVTLQLMALIGQLLLSLIPFSFRRTRKGMPFLKNRIYSMPCMIVSLIVILASMFLNTSPNDVFLKASYIALPAIIIIIYIYWRNNLTKTYIDHLNEKNIDLLNKDNAQLQQYITQLEADNRRLSAIIHKDNKLIPAMEYAVEQYLSDTSAIDNKQTSGQDLLKDLRDLAAERKGLLASQDQHSDPLPDCGNSRANHILSYFRESAAAKDIQLQVVCDTSLSQYIDPVCTEDAICTLLADLIENAVIATHYANGHHILVHIGCIANTPAIQIFDSGIAFSPEVLSMFGKKPITTHADDSGSGIGLMQTAAFLREQHASLIIEEFTSGTYTKKVAVLFDNQNGYTLYTCRSEEEIAKIKIRMDLCIIQK